MRYKLLFVFITILTFNNVSAQLSKTSKDFKKLKKSMTKISVIPTQVEVNELNLDLSTVRDSLFEMKAQDTINKIVVDVLDSKYSVAISESDRKMSINDYQEIKSLFYKLENAERKFHQFNTPEILVKLSQDDTSRYCLFNFYFGVSKTKERLRYEEKKMLPQTLTVALLTLGTVYVVPSKYYSELRTILIDKKENRIIYYRKTPSNGSTPYSYDFIYHSVKSNVRSIYYK